MPYELLKNVADVYKVNHTGQGKRFSTDVNISQVVTGLLPEQCLNNIVIMREQHCWTNNNIVHQ